MKLLRLTNGGYDMIVSYTGYETQVIRIGKDRKDKDSLNIQMKEEDKALGEAIVTGSALPGGMSTALLMMIKLAADRIQVS